MTQLGWFRYQKIWTRKNSRFNSFYRFNFLPRQTNVVEVDTFDPFVISITAQIGGLCQLVSAGHNVLVLETETDHLKNELSWAERCSRAHIYISFLLAMSTAPGIIGRAERAVIHHECNSSQFYFWLPSTTQTRTLLSTHHTKHVHWGSAMHYHHLQVTYLVKYHCSSAQQRCQCNSMEDNIQRLLAPSLCLNAPYASESIVLKRFQQGEGVNSREISLPPPPSVYWCWDVVLLMLYAGLSWPGSYQLCRQVYHHQGHQPPDLRPSHRTPAALCPFIIQSPVTTVPAVVTNWLLTLVTGYHSPRGVSMCHIVLAGGRARTRPPAHWSSVEL